MLPEVVIAAFTRKKLPIPDSERVDRVGYSAQEIEVIESELARRRAKEGAE